MTAPQGNWHRTDERHLRLCLEDEWGQAPTEPDWRSAPLCKDGFTVGTIRTYFRPQTDYGAGAPTVLPNGTAVTGLLATELRPETAPLLLALCLDRTGPSPSCCADYYTPAAPRRFTGLMADTVEIAAGVRRPALALSIRMLGHAEEAASGLNPEGFDYSDVNPVPFALARAAIELDGSSVTSAGSFALRISNGLERGPERAGEPAFISAGPRVVAVRLSKLADSDALRDALRGGGSVSLSAVFTHPCGASLTFELPALRLQSIGGDEDPSGLAVEDVRMTAAADAAGTDITYLLEA